MTTLGIVLPPRPQRLARQRRRHVEQRITAQVIVFGFADLRAYLTDRLLQREWRLATVVAELSTHRATPCGD